MNLYLTRARLKRDASIDALRRVLLPPDADARAAAAHRLVWALFSDSPNRARDFLWREIGPGAFLTLSSRRPPESHALFEVDAPKEFAPNLQPGDQLAFSLRANATVAKKIDGKSRGKPCDVVMDALHSVPRGERATKRADAITSAGRRWLVRQGESAGFSVRTGPERGEDGSVRVTSYSVLRLPHRGAEMRFGVLDFEGVLTVVEPGLFLASLARGFGRAKAYGCGLMLIRRAH